MIDEPLLTRERAERLTRRVLGFTSADEARVNITSSWAGNTRFASNEITTSGGVTDTSVTIVSTIGGRRASASTNVLDDASLRRAVELSERLARLAPIDPELMPELAVQQYASVSGYFDRTAALTPEARSIAVQRTLRGVLAAGDGATSGVGAAAIAGGVTRETSRAGADSAGGARNLSVAGLLEAVATAQAVATSRGLFAYHRGTDASLSTTARTPDGTGSGYAARGARDWGDIDPEEIGRRAARKAIASREPRALEPGRYTVVLEPQAVADLIPLLLGAFNARTADEGRSPFSKGGGTRVGEKIADERVTLLSDPTDPELLSQPFDAEGLPVVRRLWIEKGVLRNLAYSRFWARRQGMEPSGGGGGGGFKMLGGAQSLDQVIAGTQRGVLVTRFWYIRFLDPRTVTLTGLTRDGTFLIENGRITQPVKNFRFNESPLLMLAKLDEIGSTERTAVGLVMPTLRVRDFNFSSLSDAV